MRLSRRNFINGGVLSSIASVVSINSLGAQEVEVSALTHLRVKVQRPIRGSTRAIPVSNFWVRIVDLNNYCPYQAKTDSWGNAYFQISLIRGIDRPTLVVANQRQSLMSIPPWGFTIFNI